jgi:hypothetical protein
LPTNGGAASASDDASTKNDASVALPESSSAGLTSVDVDPQAAIAAESETASATATRFRIKMNS